MAEKQNGEAETFKHKKNNNNKKTNENLYDVVQRLISEPAQTATRIKNSITPLIPEASRNYARRILLWSRQGSPLRPLLLISVSQSLSLSIFKFQFNL